MEWKHSIYKFKTVILKFINSKTFRLAQLLSEKLADGITANKRKWSREKNPCKQDKQATQGTQGRFLLRRSNPDIKMEACGCGHVLKISPNSCHQGSLYRSLQKLATKQQRITENLQLSYGMAWRKQNATEEKTFLQGKNYAIHPNLEGGLFGFCCRSCWGGWVEQKVPESVW